MHFTRLSEWKERGREKRCNWEKKRSRNHVFSTRIPFWFWGEREEEDSFLIFSFLRLLCSLPMINLHLTRSQKQMFYVSLSLSLFLRLFPSSFSSPFSYSCTFDFSFLFFLLKPLHLLQLSKGIGRYKLFHGHLNLCCHRKDRGTGERERERRNEKTKRQIVLQEEQTPCDFSWRVSERQLLLKKEGERRIDTKQ